MQFFYMFSFVVAVSYAAALPQPAELSEKYSNNADATLASGLETRSYQPGLNSYKESATLTSLERRDDSKNDREFDDSEYDSEENGEWVYGFENWGDLEDYKDDYEDDSEGSSGENSGFDSFLLSTSDSNEIINSPFSYRNVSTENLAFTISNVGDGIVNLYSDGEKIEQMISGKYREIAAKYIRRHVYVNLAIRQWVHKSTPIILDKIKDIYGEDEYSKEGPEITEKIKKWEDKSRERSIEIIATTTKILNKSGSVSNNLKKIGLSFQTTLGGCMDLIWKLVNLVRHSSRGQTLMKYLGGISRGIWAFFEEQSALHFKIIKKPKRHPRIVTLPTHPKSK
ncbi:hypothetical protein BASA50_005043 [Batrachochytrium salamandrivorans]|uniref:Uncharacterized protein n=1 Tax=Batrachochytrium salamandrivorans TaxID=1357716 RepID=A0ABQ8FGW2_9FUNG|nr:hypothetical protein BASA60_005222 [Batrachochytrium salamandrivorans]KAH6584176.1 hypothetical protein BASA61_007617 [Batrachochytrium salamandrivorans]KAH6596558.1 hypothetical protein BASA50_005043 [Batrachochytrium salamandrivorans]